MNSATKYLDNVAKQHSISKDTNRTKRVRLEALCELYFLRHGDVHEQDKAVRLIQDFAKFL